jgi:DNA relaxase NicK
MKTSGHLDWLSVTFPANFNVNKLSPYVGDWIETGTAPHGWAWKRVSKVGAYAYGGGDARMKTHVTMGGVVLAAVRELGVSEKEFLLTIRSFGGRCTRIDVCVNMIDADCTVDDLWDLLQDGKIRARTRLGKRYKSPIGEPITDDGFYLGAKTSDRFLRVYDKAVELKIEVRWIRVELQVNKKKAHGAQTMITEAGNTRGAINALIKDFALFFHPAYSEALSNTDGQLPVAARKEEAFWKWMRLQIAPAVAKRSIAHPEEKILERLESLVDAARLNLTK